MTLIEGRVQLPDVSEQVSTRLVDFSRAIVVRTYEKGIVSRKNISRLYDITIYAL